MMFKNREIGDNLFNFICLIRNVQWCMYTYLFTVVYVVYVHVFVYSSVCTRICLQ